MKILQCIQASSRSIILLHQPNTEQHGDSGQGPTLITDVHLQTTTIVGNNSTAQSWYSRRLSSSPSLSSGLNTGGCQLRKPSPANIAKIKPPISRRDVIGYMISTSQTIAVFVQAMLSTTTGQQQFSRILCTRQIEVMTLTTCW